MSRIDVKVFEVNPVNSVPGREVEEPDRCPDYFTCFFGNQGENGRVGPKQAFVELFDGDDAFFGRAFICR
mgnify:FL=1